MGVLRRQEKKQAEPTVTETAAREIADRMYREGMEAGYRLAGAELRELSLRHHTQVPRHTLILLAKRWLGNDKSSSKTGVQGQGSL